MTLERNYENTRSCFRKKQIVYATGTLVTTSHNPRTQLHRYVEPRALVVTSSRRVIYTIIIMFFSTDFRPLRFDRLFIRMLYSTLHFTEHLIWPKTGIRQQKRETRTLLAETCCVRCRAAFVSASDNRFLDRLLSILLPAYVTTAAVTRSESIDDGTFYDYCYCNCSSVCHTRLYLSANYYIYIYLCFSSIAAS